MGEHGFSRAVSKFQRRQKREPSMFSKKRRQFLQQAASAGIACSANFFLSRVAQGQAAGPGGVARVYADSRRSISPLDRNLFGSFLEHLGRAIYEGIYEPGSSL